MQKFIKQRYQLIIAIISIIFLTVSIINANNDAITFDEVAHIPAGYSYLTQHDMRLNPEHPPLIKNLAAFPLLFMNLNFDVSNQDFWTKKVNGQWTAGRHLLWQSNNNPDRIIFWARIPIILLSLIFGLFIFKWAKEIAGVSAGLLAFIFYSFDPNILGHNHYVTTDLGIAAFFTFAFYYFLKFIKNPTWKNALIGGLFLGLLQLAKFSSIVAFPILGLILLFYPLIKKTSASRVKVWFSYFSKGIVAFILSIVIVWAYYIPNTYKMPASDFQKTANFYFGIDDVNPDSQMTRKVMLAMNKNDLSRPLAEYILGVGMVFKRVAGGNGAYFMGEVSDNAFVAYFPTVFALKETIPFLLLISFASLFTLFQIFSSFKFIGAKFCKKNFKKLLHWLRSAVVEYTIFGFIVLYLYLSITGNLNIGFRHLFPILPFIYILVAKKIHDFFKQLPRRQSLFPKYLFTFLLIWLIAEPIINYPYYLSYFNELAGGPKNGYHYVTDSNTDWGQDLKRLQKFLIKHPEIDKIRVDYFGGGNPKYYLGNKYIQWWDSKRPIEKGWYAVSTNFLQGSVYDTRLKPDGTPRKPDNESWRWITKYQPTYQVGTSILIYHIK